MLSHHLLLLDVVLVAAVRHVQVVRAGRELGGESIHLFHVRPNPDRLPLASNLPIAETNQGKNKTREKKNAQSDRGAWKTTHQAQTEHVKNGMLHTKGTTSYDTSMFQW